MCYSHGSITCDYVVVESLFFDPNMTPDRPILNFLNSFDDADRKEGELVFRDNAVAQIFGTEHAFQARVEIHNVYRVNLTLTDGKWESECVPYDKDSKSAMVAAMLARIALGEKLPSSPNQIGETSFGEMLEEKLGRVLKPREEMYVEKVEKRYERYERSREILDTDLVRLNPKWEVVSYDPLELWSTPPRNVGEFWNYIAYAFEKKNIGYPEFMKPLTDVNQTAGDMEQFEAEKEREIWKSRLDSALQTVGKRRSKPDIIKVKLVVGYSDARVFVSMISAESGENFEEKYIEWPTVTEIRQGLEKLDKGTLVGAASEVLLLRQIYDFMNSEDTDLISLDNEAACRMLNRMLTDGDLQSLLVTADNYPYTKSDVVLRWLARDGDPDHYELVMAAENDEPLPHSVRVLPGMEDLYLADETIFRGPNWWMESTEIEPSYLVDRGMIERPEGIEFLARIGAGLPQSLKDRVVERDLHVVMNLKMVTSLTTADSEHLVAELITRSKDGLREEKLTNNGWKVTKPKGGENPIEPGGEIVRYRRDDAIWIEQELDEQGLSYDASLDAHRARVTKYFPERFAEWARGLPDSITLNCDEVVTSLLADPVKATIQFEVNQSSIDWFDLKIVVNVDGADLTQEQIKSLVAARGGFVRMRNGHWMRVEIEMDEEQREAVNRLGLDPFDLSGEEHRMHVLQLADPGVSEVFDKDVWRKIESRADELKTEVKPAVPDSMNANLRPYQVEGYHFLSYLSGSRFGGVLADDMGLGKTVQSLTWLLWLHESTDEEDRMPALVVCPKSVLDVWSGEAEKFAPKLRVRVIRVGDDLNMNWIKKNVDLLVLNYAQLRINEERLLELEWQAVVLDEGQQIKNPDSKAAKAARKLNARNRLVLTGTPIENRLLDLWSLMAFAMPGVLGTRAYFRSRFDRRKDPKSQERLSARLRPFLLRRTKSQVATDLPPRTEEDYFCEMEGVQKELYEQELKKIQRTLLGIENDDELKKNSFAVLQGLTRLRQICCHPGLIDSAYVDEESAKMNALFYLLDQLRDEGHKVLVFSQFVSMLDIIKARLEKENRPFSYLTGQTKNRREEIDNFQRTEDANVFLLSLKAGGSGLNLTSASYVILYDPWWNPAVENQAIDRTHRIGQTQKVIAYRLLMRDSVEQKIRVLQQQKFQLFNDVLGSESFTKTLDVDDLHYIFSSVAADDREEEEKQRAKEEAKRARRNKI